MQNKIALEEHFATQTTLGDSKVFGGQHISKSILTNVCNGV